MAHKHSIYDSDAHFEINPATRAIKNVSATKTAVIQHDHNSERFTFKLPRMIEGHDMTACNVVEIHYLNIDATTKVQNKGVYTVNDLQISPDDEDMVICSWLISNNATQLVGSLHFLVRFACVSNDSVIEYAWNTAIFTAISVSSGIYNSDAIAEQYADILNAWKAELDFAKMTSVEQTEESTADGGVNIWTATFGSGEKSELRVRNGSQGVPGKSAFETAAEAGYEGSEAEFADRILGTPFAIKTVNGEILNFFIGTQAQFDALETKEPNTIYYITDDDTLDAINADIDFKVQALLAKLQAGEVIVKKAAQAETATNATNATKATNADKATVINNPALNTSILDKAAELSNDGVYHFKLGGYEAYTGNDLPSSNATYSAATVICRWGTVRVILWGGTESEPIYTNFRTNKGVWSGWESLITSKTIATQTVAKATNADNAENANTANTAGAVTMSKASGNKDQYVLVTSNTTAATTVIPLHSQGFKYNTYTDTVTAGTFKGNLTGNVTGNASTATLATRIQYTINLTIENKSGTSQGVTVAYMSNGVKKYDMREIGNNASPTVTLSNVDAGSIVAVGTTAEAIVSTITTTDIYNYLRTPWDFPGIIRDWARVETVFSKANLIPTGYSSVVSYMGWTVCGGGNASIQLYLGGK